MHPPLPPPQKKKKRKKKGTTEIVLQQYMEANLYLGRTNQVVAEGVLSCSRQC